ncbi:MAG TPA: hypothetical protein VND87_12535 [Stellaceae bacterium]|nr:hypothetical protein [Stellaceae bacterium]
MEGDEAPVHIRIGDHARGISQLADQIADRRAKLRLIGLALGLLEVMEMTTPSEARYAVKPLSPVVPRAVPSR